MKSGWPLIADFSLSVQNGALVHFNQINTVWLTTNGHMFHYK